MVRHILKLGRVSNVVTLLNVSFQDIVNKVVQEAGLINQLILEEFKDMSLIVKMLLR